MTPKVTSVIRIRSGPAEASMKRDSLVSAPPRRSRRPIGPRSAVSVQAKAKLKPAAINSASQCDNGAPPTIGPSGTNSSHDLADDALSRELARAGIARKVSVGHQP